MTESKRAITQIFLVTRKELLKLPDGKKEIEYIRNVLNTPLEQVDPWFFFRQYAFVVLCSYWKEAYAQRELDTFMNGLDLDDISNRRKRAAIAEAIIKARYEDWFKELLAAPDKLEYLDTLPMMGPATRCHLARNIGIDCVKADRHLNRLAIQFGYGHDRDPYKQWAVVTQMCRDVQDDLNEDDKEKLGTIDLIFWRACNLGWL
jgi:hypothetical protein